MDMNWCCPFTGEKYEVTTLPHMEREHIIPYATRNSNALHALVLTWPQVNRMKGKRTAKQFILESANLPSRQVQGLERLTLFTPKQFDEFVDKLDTKGHPDDARRKRARKALLATANFEDKELGFTDGALTQTSHLMKLAMRGLTQRFPNVSCDSIPGPVTAEIRKAWNLTGTLALTCPEVIDPHSGETLPKNDIRGLTHMHHALDAATLALAAHYFPLQARGQDQKGKIWQALLRRYRTAEEKAFLHKLGVFDRYERTRRDKDGKEYQVTDVRLRDLSKSVKEQLSRSLAKCRVMQHIPADRSGTKAELLTWGIVSIIGDNALIIQRSNRSLLELDADSPQRRWKDKPPTKEAVKLLKEHGHLLKSNEKRLVKRGINKLTTEKLARLLGPASPEIGGKLLAIRGALVIGDNFAIALMNQSPILIPFHQIHRTLASLTASNGGKLPRLIRIGTLIKIPRGTWKGTWRVISVKNSEAYGISVDLAYPHGIKLVKGNAKVPQMLLDGLEILPRRYTGHPLDNE
jgi:CRISPR-associated endonuclease Csn1